MSTNARMLEGMRILIVAPPYQRLPPTGYGAIERVVLGRAMALATAGAKVDVIAPKESVVPFVENTIEVRRVQYRDFHNTGNPVADYALYLLHSKPVQYSLPYLSLPDLPKYDCVFNDAFRSEPWIVGLVGMKIGWRRTISMLHANAPAWTSHSVGFLQRRLSFGALNSVTYNWLRERRWKAFHLPNGIEFPSRPDFLVDPEPYLVFIGRIGPEKGVHRAIGIAKKVHLPLKIFGKIRDHGYFLRYIKPELEAGNIDYFGEVLRNELEEYLRRSTALVFTSVWSDPYPTVILEALRFGVPIVSTRPGRFSGFYDLCNDSNSVVGSDVDEVVSHWRGLGELSRARIFEQAQNRISWKSVIASAYVNPILAMASA